MPKKEKPPKLAEWFREKIYHRFGIPGLVGLAILTAAAYVYTNWAKVKTWPGVAPVVTHITRWPVPKADHNRYSILVAHLENDAQQEHEQLIIEALKEFEGVQTLCLDRTIHLEGPVPEEVEKRGQDEAQRYLKESGASVLIWGAVLSRGSRTVYKLYWTPATGEARKPQRYGAPLAEAQLRLPEVFWGDLAEILRLQVTAGAAEFEAQEGCYTSDRLQPFISRVKKLLEASGGRPGWDADARGSTLMILANALSNMGWQSRQGKHLEEAVAAYQEALKEYTRERVPLQWAMIQYKLGNTLLFLGERESSTEHLEEAVAAFREALKERTRERVPLDWAMTYDSLGMALWGLGERERGTQRLEEAVAVFREVLKDKTLERAPLSWSATQNNLGLALTGLGKRQGSTERLGEAVTAYREALKGWTRKRAPLYWALAQTNLGNALTSLGERESGTKTLEEAVAAYQEALKEYTRERVPFYWAWTQTNLGNALTILGERESGTKILEEAVAACKAAVEVFEPAQATYYGNYGKIVSEGNLRRAAALLRERQK